MRAYLYGNEHVYMHGRRSSVFDIEIITKYFVRELA